MSELLSSHVNGQYETILVDFSTFKPCNSSVYESLRKFSAVLLALLQDDSKFLKVPEIPEAPISRPAIAGLLLSYPIIYHCKSETEVLHDVDVVVFSVYPPPLYNKPFMQFSCPLGLRKVAERMLENTVEEWQNRVENQLWDEQVDFTDLGVWKHVDLGEGELQISYERTRVPVLTL